METVKSIYLSKTFWFNVLMGVLAVTAELNPELLTILGFPPEKQHSILTIVGAFTAMANIFLRKATSTPVTFVKSKVSNTETANPNDPTNL